MNAQILTEALAGAINTETLKRTVLQTLKARYSQEELAQRLSEAASLLGIETVISRDPQDALRRSLTDTDRAAISRARELLAQFVA